MLSRVCNYSFQQPLKVILDALDREALTDAERRALGDLATKDLAARGFDADYRPTTLGRQLEDLIDVLSSF